MRLTQPVSNFLIFNKKPIIYYSGIHFQSHFASATLAAKKKIRRILRAKYTEWRLLNVSVAAHTSLQSQSFKRMIGPAERVVEFIIRHQSNSFAV